MSNLAVKNTKSTKKATSKKTDVKKTTKKRSSAVKTQSGVSQKELANLVTQLQKRCDVLEEKIATLETNKVSRKKLKKALKSVTKPSMAADLF